MGYSSKLTCHVNEKGVCKWCSYIFVVIIQVVSAFHAFDAKAQDTVSRLRHASLAIRDHLPSVDEAKSYYLSSDKTSHLRLLISEWVKSPAHYSRIQRYFSDRFGTSPFLFLYEDAYSLEQYRSNVIQNDAPLDLGPDDDGVYYLKKSIKPACGKEAHSEKVVLTKVWWSDTPVRMCQSAISEQISFPSQQSRCADPFSSKGLKSAWCGCGKQSILCIPSPLKRNQQRAVHREIIDRSINVYINNASWKDLFAGTFYGNRLLMHYYLLSDKVIVKGDVPSDDDLALLTAIPLEHLVWKDFPPGFLAQRSGIVTAPAFMKRFNNFRSRIRALSETLLCQDIDPSLNTSGISELVNQHLSAFDRSHGTRGECAGCHFALDNFGSTLLGWDDQGLYFGFDRSWRWNPPSQKGHVFGQDGQGPRFLMDSLMTLTPKFAACMAKQVWEDFSGASFDALDTSEKSRLIQVAEVGPRALFETVFTSEVFLNLRVQSSSVPKEQAKLYQFETDIMPILTKSCGGVACHSDGNGRPHSVYLGYQDRFKKAPVDRIANGSMPPPTSTYQISPEEREILVRFLGQF